MWKTWDYPAHLAKSLPCIDHIVQAKMERRLDSGTDVEQARRETASCTMKIRFQVTYIRGNSRDCGPTAELAFVGSVEDHRVPLVEWNSILSSTSTITSPSTNSTPRQDGASLSFVMYTISLALRPRNKAPNCGAGEVGIDLLGNTHTEVGWYQSLW